jgi:methionine-rich copper-binding protein CopC
MVLSVPETGKRYYLMQMLDAWTNVFAAPGTRTTGSGKCDFAIVGPSSKGALPERSVPHLYGQGFNTWKGPFSRVTKATVISSPPSNHQGTCKMMRRSSLFGLLIAIFFALNPDRAWAHAIIVESTPAINGVVAGPLLEIKLRFNERIDGGRSRLTLVSPDGVSHTVKLSQNTAPDSLSATVPDLIPGKYQLQWQVLAGDGHITQGIIPFTVIIP